MMYKKNGKLNKFGKKELRRMRKEFFLFNPAGWISYDRFPGLNPKRRIVEVGVYVSGCLQVSLVSRAICNPKDKYNRKVGELIALSRFFDGRSTFEVNPA